MSSSSKDCVHWGLLPPATDEMKEKAHLAKGRFTGDPSFEFEHTEIKKVGEGEEQSEEEETVSLLFFTCAYTCLSVLNNLNNTAVNICPFDF